MMACLTFTTTATPPPPHNKTPPPPPLLTHSVQIVGVFCGGAKDNDDEEKNYNSKLLLFGCAINSEALPLPAITVGLGDDLPIYLQIEQYYTYLFIEKSVIYLRTRCGHCEVKY